MAKHPDKVVRVTVDLPADLHEAFFSKCFLSKPRVRMNAVIQDLVRNWVGRPSAPPPRPGRVRRVRKSKR